MRSGERVSSVRALQIQLRSDGDDAGRVDVVMGHVVVPLDMVEIDGLRDTLHLVEVPKVAVEMGVVDDAPEVAFEMPVVDGIEPEQRDKQPPIGLDELGTEEVAPVAEPRVELIQRNED